jgi:hypothetical protein
MQSQEQALTLEALVWDHRVAERFVILIHHRLLIPLANDLAMTTSAARHVSDLLMLALTVCYPS